MEHASVLKGAKCWFQITNVRFQFNGQPVHLCIDLNPVTNEYSEEGNAEAGGKEALTLFNRGCLRKKLVVAVKFLLPHTPATVACERLEEVYAFDGRKASCLRDIGKELKMTPRLPRYFACYPSKKYF